MCVLLSPCNGWWGAVAGGQQLHLRRRRQSLARQRDPACTRHIAGEAAGAVDLAGHLPLRVVLWPAVSQRPLPVPSPDDRLFRHRVRLHLRWLFMRCGVRCAVCGVRCAMCDGPAKRQRSTSGGPAYAASSALGAALHLPAPRAGGLRHQYHCRGVTLPQCTAQTAAASSRSLKFRTSASSGTPRC